MYTSKSWLAPFALLAFAVSLFPTAGQAARYDNEYFSITLPDGWEEPMSRFLGARPYPSTSIMFWKPRADSALSETIDVYASDWSQTVEYKQWTAASIASQSKRMSASCMESVRRAFTALNVDTASRSCKAAGLQADCVDWRARSNGVAAAGTCVGVVAENGMALWIRTSDAEPHATKTVPAMLRAIKKMRLNKQRAEPAAAQ